MTVKPDHPATYQLLAIALPMLLAGVSTPLLGMVDTAVVGHLDEPAYLGAVALGAMIFNFIFWSLGFLRMSATGLTARAQGAEWREELHLILYRGLLVASAIGLLLVALQVPLAAIIFSLVGADEAVIELARDYFFVRVWAAPAALANYVLLGWFLGQGKASLNLLLVAGGNLLNVLLDLILVMGLGMDVVGVAAATVVAEYVILLAGLTLAAKLLPGWLGR